MNAKKLVVLTVAFGLFAISSANVHAQMHRQAGFAPQASTSRSFAGTRTGNWSGGNWGGNWHHHHHDNFNNTVFIGSFGFPFFGFGYPFGYPYGYGYGYPYGGYYPPPYYGGGYYGSGYYGGGYYGNGYGGGSYGPVYASHADIFTKLAWVDNDNPAATVITPKRVSVRRICASRARRGRNCCPVPTLDRGICGNRSARCRAQ